MPSLHVIGSTDQNEGRATLTSDDFRKQCIKMIDCILSLGFEEPIYFTAIAIDGRTTIGFSETIGDPPQPMVASASPFTLYLPPINVLFLDPKG